MTVQNEAQPTTFGLAICRGDEYMLDFLFASASVPANE
jgi:hypothetical protein